MHQGHPTGNFEKFSIKISFEIAGKNLSVPHSQQDRWKSSKPARCTYNLETDLLRSFPADVSPGTSGHFWSDHRTKFRPSVGERGEGGGGRRKMGLPKGRNLPFTGEGGGEEGGRVSDKKLMPHILHIKSQQTPTVIFFQATFSTMDISLLPNLPASKNWPEEQIF